MNQATHDQLCRMPELRVCVPIVSAVVHARHSLRDAWLLAGALMGYTGNRGIPGAIANAIQKAEGAPPNLPKSIGQINAFLRTGIAPSGDKAQFGELLRILNLIDVLPDWSPPFGRLSADPTRMMDAYDGIERHYAQGNVVLMAEVGSVGRTPPSHESDLYHRRYRLHFRGGLKNVTALNPEQREVIYAPGAAYYVRKVEVGKAKEKKAETGKGPLAHTHIYLQHVTPSSPEYHQAVAANRIVDLRHPDAAAPPLLGPSSASASSSSSRGGGASGPSTPSGSRRGTLLALP